MSLTESWFLLGFRPSSGSERIPLALYKNTLSLLAVAASHFSIFRYVLLTSWITSSF